MSMLFKYEIHWLNIVSLEVASNVVPHISEIISEILQFMHDSQHDGRNCSHFIADVLFHVLHCPWSLSYTLCLRNPQRKKSQALRLGDLAGHSVILSSWDHANWGHLVENSHRILRSTSRCPVLLEPDSLYFNTKYLQIQLQKCTKHLDLVGWISRYCFVCLVFKEIRPINLKCATQYQTIHSQNVNVPDEHRESSQLLSIVSNEN
jgi:hypothetical protein